MPSSNSSKSSSSKMMANDKKSMTSVARRVARTYLNDTTTIYPLPIDLAEKHRQSLSTLLLTDLYGGPLFTPALRSATGSALPRRVLDVCCGSGFWSMLCNDAFKARGHTSVKFTGIDIVPNTSVTPPEMQWEFLEWDMRKIPWPLQDASFDLVMAKDVALGFRWDEYQAIFDEYARVLRPGGVMEIWERDSTIRVLNKPPHVGPGPGSDDAAGEPGVYTINQSTSFSLSQNPFLRQYNAWLDEAMQQRDRTPVPCAQVRAWLAQELGGFGDLHYKRLAVPLGRPRWENGVVKLSPEQMSPRTAALDSVCGLVSSFEDVLRSVNGVDQREWDEWFAAMTQNITSEDGTSAGECLEVGVWSVTKRTTRSK